MKASDIELLHADKLITDQQRDEILARYFTKAAAVVPVPQRALVYVLSAVAGMLIVGGAIVQAVAHWQAITPLMKSVAGMLMLALAWLGYFLLRQRKPLVAETLAVVGAGLWLANILLHITIFELDVPGVVPLFLFFIGVLPIPFLMRQCVLIGVVAFFSVLLVPSMANAPDDCWLALPWLESAWGTQWSLIMALVLIWWMVGERCRGCLGMYRGYDWIIYPACVYFLCAVQHYLLYSVPSMQTTPYTWCIYAVVALCAFLLKPKGMRWLHWLSATLGSLALLPLAVHLSWHTAYREVWGMFAGAAYCGLFMTLCARSGRLLWGGLAMGMALAVFVDLMVRIHDSLSDSGLFLMATGLAVLVFAYVLEKQRRFLIRQAKNAPVKSNGSQAASASKNPTISPIRPAKSSPKKPTLPPIPQA